MERYIHTTERLLDELTEAGITLPEDVHPLILLAGLDNSFDTLITILESEENLTLERVSNRLLFTKQNDVDDNSHAPTAFKRKRDERSHALSHVSRDDNSHALVQASRSPSPSSPKRLKTNDTPKHCSFCNLDGHPDNRCYLNPRSRCFNFEKYQDLVKEGSNPQLVRKIQQFLREIAGFHFSTDDPNKSMRSISFDGN